MMLNLTRDTRHSVLQLTETDRNGAVGCGAGMLAAEKALAMSFALCVPFCLRSLPSVFVVCLFVLLSGPSSLHCDSHNQG